MKWTIGILTVPERKTELTRIYGMLQYQIGERDDIELIVHDGVESVGEKRQQVLEAARGEYFNFVDDDDLVAHNYIDTIYPLLDGADYIGFRMQHYFNGLKSKPTFHSLKYSQWSEDEKGFYRNISHLNPLRTDVARQGTFEGTYGEDARWALQVTPKTEHYIEEPMYFYFYSPDYSKAVYDGNA